MVGFPPFSPGEKVVEGYCGGGWGESGTGGEGLAQKRVVPFWMIKELPALNKAFWLVARLYWYSISEL